MKVKDGQKVYLQKYEVSYIMHELNCVPACIVNEIFKYGTPFIMSGPIDGYKFCVFEDPKNVEWLMEQDWIVDYDQYKSTPISKLKCLCEELKNEYSAGAKDFNNRDIDYREKHFEEQGEVFSKLRHRISSLELMTEHLKHEVDFDFPIDIISHCVSYKPTKKPGFFARLFGKGTR